MNYLEDLMRIRSQELDKELEQIRILRQLHHAESLVKRKKIAGLKRILNNVGRVFISDWPRTIAQTNDK